MKLLLSKSYGDKRVFDGLSLEIAEGEILCVLGASGAGKTTLLNILAGLTGFGGEASGVPERVGYVFQEPRLIPNLTVFKNLVYAGARETEIDGVLQEIGLFGHRDKKPSALSGGEKQRVAIARAFLSESPLLLLDEPFSALDLALRVKLWQTFAGLWKKKRPTVVFVTHDIEEAWSLGHRIVVLSEGKIALDIRPQKTAFPAPYGEKSEEKQRLIERMLNDSSN